MKKAHKAEVPRKLLFLSRRRRPDIQNPIAILTTRVKGSIMGEWKKLQQTLCYLRNTEDFVLLLSADSLDQIKWYVDRSYAVHVDGKEHTRNLLTLGKGAIYCRLKQLMKLRALRKQRLLQYMRRW